MLMRIPGLAEILKRANRPFGPSAMDRIPWLHLPSVEKEKARNYREEYDNYQGTPAQIKARSQRNAARRKMGLQVGDPREVDHKRPISQGGTNNPRNLRAVSQATNRHKGGKT